MTTSRTKDITLIAIFPALMAATAGIAIPLGNLPAITLQTFFVFMAGMLLGPKKAGLSMVIYLMLGAIGLPVFSNYTGGIGIILSKSGGFLIGFIFAAIFVGFMKNVIFINNEIMRQFMILLMANAIIYMFGASYISYLTNTGIFTIIAVFVPYLVGDLLKIVGVIYVGSRIRPVLTYEGSQI